MKSLHVYVVCLLSDHSMEGVCLFHFDYNDVRTERKQSDNK